MRRLIVVEFDDLAVWRGADEFSVFIFLPDNYALLDFLVACFNSILPARFYHGVGCIHSHSLIFADFGPSTNMVDLVFVGFGQSQLLAAEVSIPKSSGA